MLIDYAPILVLFVLVALFALGNVVVSELLGSRRQAIGKASAYECGMGSVGNARMRLSIHFYLVAVLFILFDVESLLLIPWAVAAKSLAAAGAGRIVLAEVVAFVVVVAVGLAALHLSRRHSGSRLLALLTVAVALLGFAAIATEVAADSRQRHAEIHAVHVEVAPAAAVGDLEGVALGPGIHPHRLRSRRAGPCRPVPVGIELTQHRAGGGIGGMELDRPPGGATGRFAVAGPPGAEG